jgi:hypothetical protein
MKNVTEFLKENREEVISFYNSKVNPFFNISLKDFMLDLIANFKKITTGEELKKFDLFGNLDDAKSRLGMFDNSISVDFDKDAYIAKKYKGTQFEQNLAL